MSKHPKADLYRAERAKGLKYREIAEKYGVSFQAVAQKCSEYESGKFRPFTEKNCVYPNLRKWLNENRVSQSEFVRRMGYVPTGKTKVSFGGYFRGEGYPQKRTIDKMLQATGLTYEELWYREGENGCE